MCKIILFFGVIFQDSRKLISRRMDDFFTYRTKKHLFFKFFLISKPKQRCEKLFHNESWTAVEYDERTSLNSIDLVTANHDVLFLVLNFHVKRTSPNKHH